jgi:hypothetical protein
MHYNFMDAIRRAVAQGNWDRLDASPSILLHLDVDPDTGQVRMLWCQPPQEQQADGHTAYMRLRMSPNRRGAVLFELSLAGYATSNYPYDVVVGLLGGQEGSSRVRVRIWGEEEGADELVVAAGELRPAWRRVTVLPAINIRFWDRKRKPVTFELLSGPPPRVLVAWLCWLDRQAAGSARTLRLPDGRKPTTDAVEDRYWGEQVQVLELPDIVEAASWPEAAARRRCAAITQELMEAAWHPRRVANMGGVEALDTF